MISGNYPAHGVLSACESEHARGEPTHSGRGRARGRVVVGRTGFGKWAARALRRAKAPSDHWRSRSSRRRTSLLDRSGRELGGGSRLGSAEAAAATGGGGRQVTGKASRVQAFSREETDSDWDSQATMVPCNEEPEEGDADDK